MEALTPRPTHHTGSTLRTCTRPPRSSPPSTTLLIRSLHGAGAHLRTAAGEPRASGADGHFWHARWLFTTSGTTVTARHLRAQPAVSLTHLRGDDLGVFCHGTAEFLDPDHPDRTAVDEHLTAHYGSSPSSWGEDIAYVRVQPRWMVVYAFAKDRLLTDTRGDRALPRLPQMRHHVSVPAWILANTRGAVRSPR